MASQSSRQTRAGRTKSLRRSSGSPHFGGIHWRGSSWDFFTTLTHSRIHCPREPILRVWSSHVLALVTGTISQECMAFPINDLLIALRGELARQIGERPHFRYSLVGGVATCNLMTRCNTRLNGFRSSKIWRCAVWMGTFVRYGSAHCGPGADLRLQMPGGKFKTS